MADAMIAAPELDETDFPHDAVAELLHVAGLPTDVDWSPVSGGANNRVYCAITANRKLLLKLYFQSEADGRDRLRGERCFYGLAEKACPHLVPQVLGWDFENRFGLFEFVQGRKLESAEVSVDHVLAAARLAVRINDAIINSSNENHEPLASEACFSFGEHLSAVDKRVDRLNAIAVRDDLDAEALAWVRDELSNSWRDIREEAAALAADEGLNSSMVLPRDQRWISPSDFGFHNALLEDNGALKFFDFEYAGWDDPAKLVADFFCQPAIPVPLGLWDTFVGELASCRRWQPEVSLKARLLLPVYRIKWCCIIMNEFLAQEASRRYFSRNTISDMRAVQFYKARGILRLLVSSTS